jgi:hypothetical protein
MGVRALVLKGRSRQDVRRGIGTTTMGVQAKFRIGVLLHNRNTNEDGWVEQVYEVGGAVMYELSIPATPSRTTLLTGLRVA